MWGSHLPSQLQDPDRLALALAGLSGSCNYNLFLLPLLYSVLPRKCDIESSGYTDHTPDSVITIT